MSIYQLLWLVPALPLVSFLILALWGTRMPGKSSGVLGTLSVGLSAILTICIGVSYLSSPPSGDFFQQTLWTWFDIAGFSPGISLYLDPVSLIFTFVITFVGFLIHLYSTEFMQGDKRYAQFFAYMNLFVFSMLMLVLADNLLLLYLGWEGVGLCSFLLIGFWYEEKKNS